MSLEVRDLSVAFRRGGPPVVDAVSFCLAPGEVVALVGESGSGKSSIARAIGGLLPATASVSGSIALDGLETVGSSEREYSRIRGRQVSMVFQDPVPSLNPVMSVGAQVRESLRCAGRTDDLRGRSAELIRQTGIADAEAVLRKFPHQLSGGMCQRVMIAMALAGDAPYLVADEPTTALDVSVQARILDLVRSLVDGRGLGVLLITHDFGVVADLADRVVVLQGGRVVESGDVVTVFGRPATSYTRSLLASSLSPLSRPAPATLGRAG